MTPLPRFCVTPRGAAGAASWTSPAGGAAPDGAVASGAIISAGSDGTGWRCRRLIQQKPSSLMSRRTGLSLWSKPGMEEERALRDRVRLATRHRRRRPRGTRLRCSWTGVKHFGHCRTLSRIGRSSRRRLAPSRPSAPGSRLPSAEKVRDPPTRLDWNWRSQMSEHILLVKALVKLASWLVGGAARLTAHGPNRDLFLILQRHLHLWLSFRQGP